MRSNSPTSVTPADGAAGAESKAQGSRDASAGDAGRAALGPMPEPVSAAENPAPARRADSPAEARGRLTLSTAFVRAGPDGVVTVELKSGRVLVLREVELRPRDFCGSELSGPADVRFCGNYADVTAARPGGAPAPAEPDPALADPGGLRPAPPARPD